MNDINNHHPPSNIMRRIAMQIDRLIMPDLRPLAKLLHERVRQSEKQRVDTQQQMEAVHSEAMAAATELMLSSEADWQSQSGNYFDRLEDQCRRKK